VLASFDPSKHGADIVSQFASGNLGHNFKRSISATQSIPSAQRAPCARLDGSNTADVAYQEMRQIVAAITGQSSIPWQSSIRS
jgi:hypothetical protein